LLSAAEAKPHRLAPIPVHQVVIEDEFWSPKLRRWREMTIVDCFTKFENDRGGAINNFDLVRDGKVGKHAGPPWYDGLLYEMVRASADFLAAQRDTALEARLDGYIKRIVDAQARDPDGYINTWTQTMASQRQRWGMNGGDDRTQHDVYNAGAMIEAGVHYYRATGHPTLLEGATRMANLMCDTIGPPPKANVVPGHSLPEEASVELYCLYRDVPDVLSNRSFVKTGLGRFRLRHRDGPLQPDRVRPGRNQVASSRSAAATRVVSRHPGMESGVKRAMTSPLAFSILRRFSC